MVGYTNRSVYQGEVDWSADRDRSYGPAPWDVRRAISEDDRVGCVAGSSSVFVHDWTYTEHGNLIPRCSIPSGRVRFKFVRLARAREQYEMCDVCFGDREVGEDGEEIVLVTPSESSEKFHAPDGDGGGTVCPADSLLSPFTTLECRPRSAVEGELEPCRNCYPYDELD